jgi:hypothetical protein
VFTRKTVTRALVVLALGLSPLYAAECVRRGNDFLTMWGGWRLVLEGKYLYDKVTVPGATPCPWPNPPSFTFFTSPLGLLGPRSAGFVWFYLKLALLVWACAGLKRLNDASPQRAPGGVTVPVLLTACWCSYDFVLGHMNLVAIALTLASLTAFVEERPRRAALWASLAAICKGPALLLPIFFAARRRIRLSAATLALFALWVALPAVVWGPAKTWRYNRDFVQSVSMASIYDDIEVGWAENWSLPALVMRVLGPVPDQDRYSKVLDLAHLPRPIAELVSQGAGAAGILALGVWWWSTRSRATGVELHFAALAATATLVFSPVTRKAYLPTLLLPYLVLWGFLATSRRTDVKRRVAVLLAVSIGLSYLTHTDLWGRQTAFFFETWHVITLSLLLLLWAQLDAARVVVRASQASALVTASVPDASSSAAPHGAPARAAA